MTITQRFLLITSISLAAVTTAQAEDGKVYPGTFCQGSLVGNPPITHYDGRHLRNDSTTNSAVVVCPAVKDNVFSTAGLNEAYMRIYKARPTCFISTLYSYSAFGTASYSQNRSDCQNTGYRTLSYSPINSYSQGYYQFVVVIPPGTSTNHSAVISYRLDEN